MPLLVQLHALPKPFPGLLHGDFTNHFHTQMLSVCSCHRYLPPWRCHSYAKDDRVKQTRMSGQKPASALPGTSPYHLLLHKRLDRGKSDPFRVWKGQGSPAPQKVSRLAKCLSPKYFSFPATWTPPYLAPCWQVLNFCALKFI